MKTIEIGDARKNLGKYAGHKEDLPFVITDRGRPVAAVLPVPNADMETVSLSTNAKFIALVDRSRERQGREGGISSGQMRKRLDIAPTQKHLSVGELKKEIRRRKRALPKLTAERDALDRQIAELKALDSMADQGTERKGG